MVEESCVCDLLQSQAFLVRVRPLYVTGWNVCKMGDDSPEYGYTCIFHQPNWKLSNMNHRGCLSRATLHLKVFRRRVQVFNKGISFKIQIYDERDR